MSRSISSALPSPLAQLLEVFGWTDRDATIMPNAMPGFSGACVWKLGIGSGCFAVRRWPSNSLSATRLVGLHALLRYSVSQGFTQFPVPLTSIVGESLIRINATYWQLEPWMPGNADYSSFPHPDRLRNVMHVLARWHRQMETYNPEETVWQWFRPTVGYPRGLIERLEQLKTISSDLVQWETTLKQLQQRSNGRIELDILREILQNIRAVCPAIITRYSPLTHLQVVLNPCLRDIWHDHVLFTGNQITGMIDATACRVDHVAADLSRLLGSLLEDDRVAWSDALDAYQSIRPLGLSELELVSAYDATNVVLSGLTWVQRLSNQICPEGDLARIMNRLNHISRRLKNLIFGQSAKSTA